MSVLEWPSYLLSRIPPPLRERMSAEAEEGQCSVADVVRSALCEHYGLDCDLRSRTYSMSDRGSMTMVLRLQPDVYEALWDQARAEVRPMREVVLDVLHAHYGMTP